MLVAREVFQAKFGRGDEVVAQFQALFEIWDRSARPVAVFGRRILTDASGAFFTVVAETVVADFAAWQAYANEELAMPEFAGWFERLVPLVESGRREFYTVAVTS